MSKTVPSIVPHYIEARIRQSAPPAVRVLPGSTPVVAFGDVQKARVATLGWNPSKIEFLDNAGQQLVDDERRLETLASLQETNLNHASSDTVYKVLRGCTTYFGRRPYLRWFGKLERILRHVNASYFDGSACHLDLVQWATNPVWGDLEPAEKETLLKADIPFLRRQIAQEQIQLLLLNGAGVMRAYCEYFGESLTSVPFPTPGRLELYTGRTANRVRVVGWNINLQSSFGVSNEEIDAIGKKLPSILRKMS
jgi:hypothetical protein